MDKAKQAVSDFMHKAGNKDTSVHEQVAPAVTHETVKPTQHENVTTAVDREVHQDHHHTTVQPIQDQQVLAEKHTHNIAPTEHREFRHGKESDHAQVTGEQFKDQRHVAETHHTHTAAPTVAGEHVHHHVHETVQPVIHKETIQPHIVHTTVPIHEVHHNPAQHHGTSTMAPISMSEFEQRGGALSGHGAKTDKFAGEPGNIAAAGGSDVRGTGTTLQHGGNTHHHHHHHAGQTNAGTGVGQSNVGTGIGQSNVGTATSRATVGTDADRAKYGTGAGDPNHGKGPGSFDSDPQSHPQQKSGLLAKLDPRVDSNGDGKAGFMS